MRLKTYILVLGVVGLSGGCFSGKRSVKHAEGYNLIAPSGWQEHGHGENERAYKLPSGNLVAVTSSCDRHAQADLQILTRDLLLGTRKQTYKKQEHMTINGAKALYSSLVAQLEGKPVHYEAVVLSKDNCIFDFTMVSRKAIGSADVSQFLSFVKSFQYAKN